MRKHLIDKWFDSYSKISNKLYRWENGVQTVVAINPVTIETSLFVDILAGATFEREAGVPNGTAHLLEHIMAGNPNKRFRQRDGMLRYALGTKSYPPIYTNASIGSYFFSFYGSVHKKGTYKLFEYIRAQLDYPSDNLEKYIEKERAIVLAEQSRLPKLERDRNFLATKFVCANRYLEFTKRNIGEPAEITQITKQDLEAFLPYIYNAEGVVISIQTNESLNNKQWQQLAQIASLFNKQAPKFTLPKKEELPNERAVYHFQDPDRQEVFLSFNYITPLLANPIDYPDAVLRYLLNKLIRKVAFEHLRETENLVYGVDTLRWRIGQDWQVYGFKLSCAKENLPKVLALTSKMIEQFVDDYLDSPMGRRWFTSTISEYVFPQTKNYSEDYASDIARDILVGHDYKFNDNLANKTAKTITIQILKEYFQQKIKGKLPRLWIESPYQDSEILPLIADSDFYPGS